MSTEANTSQPIETQQPAQPQEDRGALVDAALVFGGFGTGIGGIAQTLDIAKHWNDPPTPQATITPPEPAVSEAPASGGPEQGS